MSIRHHTVKTVIIFCVTALAWIAYVSLAVIPLVTASTYTGAAKPMTFYFHYINNPVSVAGLETKYIMNTSQTFHYQSNQEAYSGSFYKPIGLPKIVVDYYLYPNFAGPVTINGTWQVFIWVNSSAYKPATFNLQFKETTIGGVEVWDSGQVNPTVTSTVGSYIDVPLYNYNLSTPLTHTFQANTTLHISIEVNAGSSADTRIWYDSPLFPSKAILPVQDYARPVDIKTYAYDDSETTLFYYNWSVNQRIVIVRANVTNPFGGYDIHRVNMTILDPGGTPVIQDADMMRTTTGQWPLRFLNTFEANWSYPESAQLGNYTILISVIDNNGYYQGLETGSVTPFIEQGSHVFTIGVLVYYDPAFLIVDDKNDPLPNAQVYITWPNGSRDILPRYTSANGFINLTHVLSASYGFTILWKDVVVNQTSLLVEDDGPYSIKTAVYQLDILVHDNTGAPVSGAYVIIYTSAGVGSGLGTTNAAGKAVFKLPTGTYALEAHYSGGYWLNVVTTSATETSVAVTGSMAKTIVLTEFPPPIWNTLGFGLLIGLVVIAIAGISVVFIRRRRTS